MKSFFLKHKYNFIFSACAIAFMLLMWIISYYSVRNEYVVPSLLQTFKTFFKLFTEGDFWLSFLNTVLKTVISFAVSFIIAGALSAFSVYSKNFAVFIKPVIGLLRTLPTLAVVLVLLVWTNPDIAPLIVASLVLFPMIYAQIFSAAEGIDGELLEMARIYSFSKRDKLIKIYLPLSLPYILRQTGANISLGLKLVISAEVLSNTFKSLGGLMRNAQLYADMPRLAALTAVAVIVGLVFEIAFSQSVRITNKWNKKENGYGN